MRCLALLFLPALLACAGPPAAEPESGLAWKQTNSSVHERLAGAALRRGDFAGALANAREALRVSPGRPGALLVLARALLMTGASPEAEIAARRALEVRPVWAEAWLVLAESLLDQDREADARDAYWEAVGEGSAQAALILGAIELKQGHESSAVRVLAEVSDWSDPTCLNLLASHYWVSGRSELAEEVLERALEHSPENEELLWKLFQVRFSRGDHTPFLERLRSREAQGRFPTDQEVLLQAASLLAAGEGALASRAYRRLSASHPEDGGLRLALGEALLLESDHQGAEAAFRAAARVEDFSRPGLVGIARARMRAGRPDAAITPLRQALKLDPAHVPTRSLLVAAWAASGDLERAAAEAEQVRLRSPGGALDHACRRLLARRGRPSADVYDELP